MGTGQGSTGPGYLQNRQNRHFRQNRQYRQNRQNRHSCQNRASRSRAELSFTPVPGPGPPLLRQNDPESGSGSLESGQNARNRSSGSLESGQNDQESGSGSLESGLESSQEAQESSPGGPPGSPGAGLVTGMVARRAVSSLGVIAQASRGCREAQESGSGSLESGVFIDFRAIRHNPAARIRPVQHRRHWTDRHPGWRLD